MKKIKKNSFFNKHLMLKMLLRSIKHSMGRFCAITLIAFVGVAFFTGLKNSEPSMKKTASTYLLEQNMYDIELYTSIGVSSQEIDEIKNIDGVKDVNGAFQCKEICSIDGYEDSFYLFLSADETIAKYKLTYGSNIQNDNEILADDEYFTKNDIGKTVKLSDEKNGLTLSEYTIVGLCHSPRFISTERIVPSISGKISAFFYAVPPCFNTKNESIYHEALICLDKNCDYFDDEYQEVSAKLQKTIAKKIKNTVSDRYNSYFMEAEQQLNSLKESLDKLTETKETLEKNVLSTQSNQEYVQMMKQLLNSILTTEQYEQFEANLASAEARTEQASYYLNDFITNIYAPLERQYNEAKAEFDATHTELNIYTFGLDTNIGIMSFKNDSAIVSGLANVFPFFFIMIAMLVCLTTMSCMIADERQEIGCMKALGYNAKNIALKYLLYSGTASVVGCTIGFFFGTGVLPIIIWSVYGMSYKFSPLKYNFNAILFIVCLLVVIVATVMVTLYSLSKTLKEKPADLVRPKVPSNGKKIFLEKIKPLWIKLSFLTKISIRNAFRYKKRLFMMLTGIAGCTALVVTGLGVQNSVSSISEKQYNNIVKYDAVAICDAETDFRSFEQAIGENGEYVIGYNGDLNINARGNEKQATVIAINTEDAASYVSLNKKYEKIKYPYKGGAIISKKLAQILEAEIGEKITFKLNGKTQNLTVNEICDNYIGHYVYISTENLEETDLNAVYCIAETKENADELVSNLRNVEGVLYVSAIKDEQMILDKSLTSMSSIVVLIVAFAGALALIVLFNLTNINIMERIREIATIKVLGFKPKETALYIFGEIILLSLFGSIIGLPFGVLLHKFIMSQILIDKMTFDFTIFAWSFFTAISVVIGFSLIACLIMLPKLNKINMAESLKSVE